MTRYNRQLTLPNHCPLHTRAGCLRRPDIFVTTGPALHSLRQRAAYACSEGEWGRKGRDDSIIPTSNPR